MQQTARSAVEANAFFRVWSDQNDFIGSYVRAACDRHKNKLLSMTSADVLSDEVR